MLKRIPTSSLLALALLLASCDAPVTEPTLGGDLELAPSLNVTFAVTIDIKPELEGEPNSINCTPADQTIAVAILTTDDFQATTVDHTTVTFEGASELHVDKKFGEPRRHEEDVEEDGDMDLVFHFRLGDTGLTCYSTEGTLTGETFDGMVIEATDDIRMVGGDEAFPALQRIAAGARHTCGLSWDGTAYCWGRLLHVVSRNLTAHAFRLLLPGPTGPDDPSLHGPLEWR